jgi:hypothetical protein
MTKSEQPIPAQQARIVSTFQVRSGLICHSVVNATHMTGLSIEEEERVECKEQALSDNTRYFKICPRWDLDRPFRHVAAFLSSSQHSFHSRSYWS